MIKCNGYKITIVNRSISIESPNGFYVNTGLFYYSPNETKDLHKHNLRAKRQNYFLGHRQLVAMDHNILDRRVYTRLINTYIKGEC